MLPVSLSTTADSSSSGSNSKSSEESGPQGQQRQGRMIQKKDERLVRDVPPAASATATRKTEGKRINSNNHNNNSNSNNGTSSGSTSVYTEIDELCKNGHVRTLCWNLLHEKHEVRQHTSE